MITTQHVAVDRNIAATHISVAPWALDNPDNAPTVERFVADMKAVQEEDTYGCHILQQGVKSKYNDFSVIHPKFESTLIHYHNWMLDRFLKAE
jgi:hypothetical protein